MHKDVLSKEQLELLPLIKLFAKEYYLVGGTAIALHIGHRRSVDFEGIIKIPTLLDLAAMKAYALGGRAKWKDYVDLYFIIKDHAGLKEISKRAKEIFQTFFNEKLFREQLSYFKDIDDSEKLEYIGTETKDEVIKKFLIEKAITPF